MGMAIPLKLGLVGYGGAMREALQYNTAIQA